MRLLSVGLRQFRNQPRLDFVPTPGLNVLIGPNGAGKSNLLEAIAVLCTGQSHRGAEARQMIQDGKDEMALVGEAEGEEPLSIDLRQKRGRARQMKVNNRAVGRFREWLGRLPVVTFSPDDLELVKGEPSVRRRAVNGVLCQVDPEYADALGRYQRLLEERNAALRQIREGGAKPSVLEPWDLSLLKEGALLTLARQRFLNTFGPRVQSRQHGLSSGRDRGVLVYRPSFHLPAEASEAVIDTNRRRFAELREGEIALGSTLIGPHRDDIEFRLDDEVAKTRASQGQARTLALAWKWEERLFIKERLGRQPLCLLDDVFSELDPDRREQLTDLLTSGAQCFVTVTDLSSWGSADTAAAAVFEIRPAGENAVRL